MRWDFKVGDFVVTKRKPLAVMKIYEILVQREKDELFHSATYEVMRRDLGEDLVESWPKIFIEAHYEKLNKKMPKILYG